MPVSANQCKLTIMFNTVRRAFSFDADLGAWDTMMLASAKGMFEEAFRFIGSGLQFWDTSNLQSTERIFAHAASFNGNLKPWDLSQVISTREMCKSAAASLQVVNSPNIYPVHGASSFNGDVETWNVSRVEDMSGMCKFGIQAARNLPFLYS